MSRRISRLAGVIAGVTTLGILGLSSPVHANHPAENRISRNNTIQVVPNTPNLSDYIWHLHWRYRGVKYHGKLIMNGNGRGYLTVYASVLHRPVRQNIKLKTSNIRNRYILQGYNVDHRKHPNYAPDRFYLQLGHRDNIRQIFHSSTGRNLHVSYEKIPRH